MKAKTILLKIILVILVFSIVLPVGLLSTAQRALATGPYECWSGGTEGIPKAVNANVLRVESCSEVYVFDPTATINNKTPTFVSTNNNDVGSDHTQGSYQARIVNCGGVLGVQGTDPNGAVIKNAQGESCRKLEDAGNFANAAEGGYTDLCSMIKNTNCTIWDGKKVLGAGGNQEAVDGTQNSGKFNIINKGGHLDGPICTPGKDCNEFITDVSHLPQGTAEGETCSSQGGALSFLFCPILESVSGAIIWLIGGPQATDTNAGLLVDLLKIPPLDANTPSGQVISGVLNSIIAFVNVFYILLFVVIIFANVIPLGIDNYTIKKTLPRLIIAIILTQFSFLICSIAVDIGNLLGFGIPDLLFKSVLSLPALNNVAFNAPGSQVGGIPTALAAAIPFAGGFAGFIGLFATIGIIIVVVLFVVVLVGILIAFFWLMARYLIVYFLIFLTPLAFAAFVLPGTQKYFKMWAEDFVKVLLTFPLVTGMLAGSIVISKILSAVLNAQRKPGEVGFGIKEIMVGLIPVIALLAIPKTLKWGGKISSAVGGAIGGYIGAKAGSAKNVAKGAGKSGAKAGYSMAKPEAAVRMGRSNNRYVRSAGRALAGKENLIPGQRGEANWQRFRGGLIEQHRKDAALRFATMDSDGTGHELGNILEQLAVRPNDERLQGQAQAAIARLGTLGSRGYAQLAQAQNRYNIAVQNNGGAALNAASIGGVTGDPGVTPANRATAAWRDMIGASGIYSDVDTKAPELLDVSTTAAGAPNQYNTVTIGGNDYQVRDEVVDLHNKGAGDLGQVKAGTVATMANQTNPVFERQAAQLNWQAASTMARTPQLHPKDAAAIDIWRQVAQRGVAHWEAAGNAAAAAGDDAAFEEATRNQQYAQDIIDHL